MPGNEDIAVLPPKLSGGPKGLGDPDDKTLRKVEVDVMIPKKMREVARNEKCTEEVNHFNECCKNNNVLMVIKCRNENAALKECLTKWYQDKDFQERCKNEYLEERSNFRRTGITQKQKQLGASM
ncbi:COX assembly mitochondrial protein homolog [Agrilus planipennis]|uniref:COX assembly mitochondrial protein n=1 Tax=Agrilus planipennis TaxID=224129 RepID=A0A1W4WVS5_AGRPL|nr:COX assembly mitochondrial protein homolog [Agrilus planipennis]